MPHSEARERVLLAAEQLFTERGFEAVTIKDIAKKAGVHHASLYHHTHSKEDLFVEVMERHLLRHQQGMAAAIAQGGNDLRAQLQAIAAWLLSQPPLDLIRMTHSDMPAMQNHVAADHISTLAHGVLFEPIAMILEQAQTQAVIRKMPVGNITGAIVSAILGIHAVPEAYVETSRQAMANEIIDVFLRGLKT